MSKTFKLIIVLVITTYHFSFVFCNYYSEPKSMYRPRKSGTWSRSLQINWPRKAFEISDLDTEKFLKEIESRMPPKPPLVQQWPAAVETRPRKKDKFPETVQISRQEKDVDMVQSEELPPNVLEEPTEKIKNSQKKIQHLKEEIRKEKQNKDHYPKSSQVVEENSLRGGYRHSGLVSRQHDYKNSKYNHHCVKKCYTPKCEVECSADKCRASTRGSDSAAVCKGEKCKGFCFKAECIAACEGGACTVKCQGNICHAVAEGPHAESVCEGDFCVAYGKGPETKPKCQGKQCQTWCVGDNCIAKCIGFNCEAMCVGKNCTKFHYSGSPPKPDKPWIMEAVDSKSEEISISDESGIEKHLATKPNKYKDNTKVDDDGYYGNKNYVKNTINGEDGVKNDNKGYIDNSGNVPFLPVQVPISNTATGDVTLDYSIAIQLGKRLGDYLKTKMAELKDLSLLRYLPSL